MFRAIPMQNYGWRGIVSRVTTAGPYADGWFSMFVLSTVVAAGIFSVAAADRAARPEISIAPLYVLPLALAALLYPLRVGIALSALCLAMHHVMGAILKLDASHLSHDATALAGYLFVVVVVNRLGQQRNRLAQVAQRQRDELAAEIRLAAEVQQNILPRRVPHIPGFDIAARMQPARLVAGDYYGFIEQPDGSVAIVIADVAGKGVAAGLLMPSIEIALRLNSPHQSTTKKVIQDFNRVVWQLTGGSRFISLFYGKLSPARHQFEYTNAGHNPPLLLRKDSVMQLCAGGPVLGVLPEATYATDAAQLQNGDLLVLYTDGVVEAENSKGEFYSVERLQSTALALADQPAERIAEAIYESVLEFQESTALNDDATVVVIRVLC
jgi:serine phosphatase RsbU (regulator of sigma subunit)